MLTQNEINNVKLIKQTHDWKESDITICKESRLEKIKLETKKVNKL